MKINGSIQIHILLTEINYSLECPHRCFSCCVISISMFLNVMRLCIRLYICVYMYIYIYIYIYKCIFLFCKCLHLSILRIPLLRDRHIYVPKCVRLYIHIYIYMRIFVHMHNYVYIYAYIYIHIYNRSFPCCEIAISMFLYSSQRK
jgi:hypothetical protein